MREVIILNKRILTIGILFLLVFSTVIPLSLGYNIKIPIEKEIQVTKSSCDDIDWWPMFRHDLQHSGYSTSRTPDYGNVLWSYKTGSGVWSSPAVVNGKVYIGSGLGNVYCFTQPPNKPVITGRKIGKPGVEYEYKFSLYHLWGYDLYCYIDWDDGNAEKWIGPYASGDRIVLNHTWNMTGTYLIKAKAKDIYGGESDWSTLQVTMPRNRAMNNLFFNLFEKFPLLREVLLRLINL